MEATVLLASKSAPDFVFQLSDVELINHTMDGDQCLGLLGRRIEALGDEDDANTGDVSCWTTRIASAVSRASRDVSSTSTTSNGGGEMAAAIRSS